MKKLRKLLYGLLLVLITSKNALALDSESINPWSLGVQFSLNTSLFTSSLRKNEKSSINYEYDLSKKNLEKGSSNFFPKSLGAFVDFRILKNNSNTFGLEFGLLYSIWGSIYQYTADRDIKYQIKEIKNEDLDPIIGHGYKLEGLEIYLLCTINFSSFEAGYFFTKLGAAIRYALKKNFIFFFEKDKNETTTYSSYLVDPEIKAKEILNSLVLGPYFEFGVAFFKCLKSSILVKYWPMKQVDTKKLEALNSPIIMNSTGGLELGICFAVDIIQVLN